MQSVPITTNVVSSNPAHDWVNLIQNYVIKFVSDLRQAFTNKTNCHDKTELLLKVALNNITLKIYFKSH